MMGCDIHPHIEYKDSNDHWWHFAYPQFWRNYALFAAMAGVRNYWDDLQPVAEKRGIPEDSTWETQSDFTLWVSDDCPDDSGNCSSERAERWVASGFSQWVGDDKKRVTNPDWHSASWLTLDEFKQAIKVMENYHPEWKANATTKAVVAAMEELKKAGDVRLVFWFDN